MSFRTSLARPRAAFAVTLSLIAFTLVGDTFRTAAFAGPLREDGTSRIGTVQTATGAYYGRIATELTGLGFTPRLLLGVSTPEDLLPQFQRNSVQGTATFSDVLVSDQPFTRAIRIATDRKPQEWMTHIQHFSHNPIHKGDVLYVTAWVRATQVPDGKPAGVGRLYASEERGGNGKDSAGLYAADFAIPVQKWTRLHFAMTANRDHGPDDELKLMFTFGHTSQTIEIGGIAAFDLGPNADKLKLPHDLPVLDYPGRGPDAAWHRAAEARIEKIRKADLTVLVTDEKGHPLKNADVTVRMTRSAFYFGSSLPIGMLPGQHVKPWNADFARTAGAPEADKKRLQQELLRLFNAATTSVTWVIWEGGDARIAQSDILAGLTWLHDNHIACLDSQAVYPSPEFTPEKARTLMSKASAAQFGQAVDDYIRFCATKLPVDSLQIANEIEGRPQYTDVLGMDAVSHWFRIAREANPKKPLMINGPYRLGESVVKTENRGTAWPSKDSEGLQYYYDLIAYLRKQGAPMDYIGFQNHTGTGSPGPEAVLKTLDQFATLGLPIQVTEFEVTLPDGTSAEQRKYQADYVRDYFTAVFSHPSARGIMLQDFWQPGAWQYEGASCFFNADWSLNPHGKVYEDLVLNKWRTQATGKTDSAGRFHVRGFLGDYAITVANGATARQTVTARLSRPGVRVPVKLSR